MTTIEIGRRITFYREKKKMKKNQLANLAGISPTYINDLENGKKCPTVEFLGYICDALGITLSVFFSNEIEKAELSVENLTPLQKQYLNNFLQSLQ